jgi:chromatin licensing and DNA replication factor 1
MKIYRKDFLKSLGIKDVPFDELKRWHPKFDLENVREIEEADLPKPPIDDSIKCKTGQELLSIAKDIKSARVSLIY